MKQCLFSKGCFALRCDHCLHTKRKGTSKELHLGVVLNDGKVLHEAVLKGAVGEIPHVQDVFDLDLAAGAPGNALAVLTEHLGHAGTDGAEA